MTKKIITILLALAMLAATACTQDNSSEPARENSSSASDSSYLDSDYENSSSDADDSSDSSSENSTTTSETTTTTTTTSATTTTENSTATTTTKAQAPTTTKNTTQATTQATQKPVQTTKATTKATQATPTFNAEAYINQTIAEINSMFPQSQFNKALYDKFERLCKGIPTSDDLYQIKEQLCNYAMRKYNGKKGTFTYYQGITPTPRTSTVTAAKPISITIDRTLGENDAHQNNGEDTNLVYTTKRSAAENYKYIGIFIRGCYGMVDSGVPALIKTCDNQNPNISYKHTFYVFIGLGGHNYSTGTTEYYLWFCEGERL